MDIPSKLIVAAITVPHVLNFTPTNSSGGVELSGYEGRLLDVILTALGIDYELRSPEDGHWGQKNPDGNWTGMVGMIQRGEADLAFSSICITDLRKKDIDFSVPYATEDSLFTLEQPDDIELNLAFLYPFTETVWMCLIVALASITAVYFITYKGKLSYGYILSCFYSSLLRQPLAINGSEYKKKGLVSFWLLFAFVISSGYSATLLSFLTVPLHGKALRNFQQLSAAVLKGTHRIFAVEGDMAVPYLKRSHERHLSLLGSAIEENGWYFKASDSHSALSRISPTTAVLQVRNEAELFNSIRKPKGRIILSDEILYSLPVAIAVRKGFCCMPELNEIVSRINQGGLFQKFLREESLKFFLMHHSLEGFSSNDFRTVSIETVFGPLLLLCLGHLLSFIVFIGEIIIFKLKKVK